MRWGVFTWYPTSDGLYLEKLADFPCEEPDEWRTMPWGDTALRRKVEQRWIASPTVGCRLELDVCGE